MKEKLNQYSIIKDVRNIETIVNTGYGLACMNEKRIKMNTVGNFNMEKTRYVTYIMSLIR